LAALFAFIGGMILNLMPCVLPVLSLKVLSFMRQAEAQKTRAWRHGLVFSAGVLTSFWVLAALLLILRAGGQAVGWGFQLQSPYFVLILAAFFFLFGLNLFGVFEFGTSFASLAGVVENPAGYGHSFLTGVLAAVVATPCTAPFMGAALGFSLAQPATVSLLIFTCLGLGMAFPYLLLSFSPSLLAAMPKPGMWMISLEQFMGFLLMASVVWLLGIFGLQTGLASLNRALACLLAFAFAAWMVGRWAGPANAFAMRFVARGIALLVVAGALAWALSGLDAAEDPARPEGLRWEPYSAERLASLRAEGKPVFIDFTAAWCLTCQVNERLALADRRVQEKFRELGVATLKADWTRRDEEITQALAGYGRNSVPLYVLYGRADEPVILPEILTPGQVLKALDEMGKEARKS
jgi:thiol:disulfide interchange protein DsbD